MESVIRKDRNDMVKKKIKSWRYSSTIDLGTRWRCGQLQFPAALLPGKEHRYQLKRRLHGPQSRSGRYGEKKNLAPAGNVTLAAQPVAIPTELPRFF
jgi:hypothetical protein